MNDITSKQSDANVFVHELDLASLASVEAFATKFNQQSIPLHILVNNAGYPASIAFIHIALFLADLLCSVLQLGKTEDGHSTMWQTNHLSHFYLVNLLWDSLKLVCSRIESAFMLSLLTQQGAPSRVVVVASRAHARGVLNISEIESPAWFSESMLDIVSVGALATITQESLARSLR
jgi:NAD(P)-dependent dehydrogenase (short-subunit alcohol dehydrogenase family)